MSKISGVEVADHRTRESCWIVVHEKVYDVTGFLDSHPGGAAILLKLAGQDATDDYESVHNPELIEETLPPTAFIGTVDATTIPKPKAVESSTPKTKQEYPPLSSIVNLDDFEAVAQKYLTSTGWAYYASAADDESTHRENSTIYQKIKLRPRVMRNVDTVNTNVTILGRSSTLPIYLSSVGLGKYAHPDAECAMAAGAGKEGLCQLIPTSPSMPLDAIYGARSVKDQTFFQQLYVNRDREKAIALIKRVEKLGVSALWITVDSPVLGKRTRDDREKAASSLSSGISTAAQSTPGVAKVASSGLLNPTLTWDDLTWIRQATRLPLVLKGIQSVEDAVLAYQAGVQGIVLSNHGGRSQDTAQAPIMTLLEIRTFAPYLIGSRMEIYIDGGVRRGTDVIKALALGATAVGIGRPCLYSMTGGYGEAGFRRMVEILRIEIESNMALLGATSIKDIVPEMVNAARLQNELIGRPRL